LLDEWMGAGPDTAPARRTAMLQVEERVRGRVAVELGRVNRFIATIKGEARPEELEGGGDNTPVSEVTDATQIVEEREVRTQLLDYLVERAIDLERALHRIAEGTYGVCVRCDRFIHPERLRALPEASLCLECRKAVESERAPSV
jgi:RNA polymerase-binding transcription factor DksA